MGTRLLKTVIWVYLSLGVLILLAIGYVLIVLPSITHEDASPKSLSVLETILLWWGVSLLPFLKIGQTLIIRNRREKDQV